MAIKCYYPVFTFQRKQGDPTGARRVINFGPPTEISLVQLFIKSGLFRDEIALEGLKELIVCCDSKPDLIEDARSLSNLHKFISFSNMASYVLLEKLFCLALFGDDSNPNCNNIDGSEIKIISIRMIDASKATGGGPETKTIIEKIQTFCNKCQEDQTANTYNQHFCTGIIRDPPNNPDGGGGLDNLPPTPPLDPLPDGDPRETLEDLLSPDPPVQDSSSATPQQEENKFDLNITDPCDLDDSGQPLSKQITVGIPVTIDQAATDQNILDIKTKLNQWLMDPKNIDTINQMTIDFESIDINSCLEKNINVHFSSTSGGTISVFDAKSWVNHMSQVGLTNLLNNTTLNFSKDNCSITYNVLPNNTYAASTNKTKWQDEKFPVSFYIKLPDLLRKFQDPKTKKNIAAPAPIAPPIPSCENDPESIFLKQKYFELLDSTNKFGQNNAKNYNAFYNQIIANRDTCEAIFEDIVTPVYGISDNKTFFPYGSSTKSDDTIPESPDIPIFHSLYFPTFIKVPIKVTIKFIAIRNIISGELDIKVVCKNINARADSPFDKKEEDDGCSNVDPESMFYSNKAPNAPFRVDVGVINFANNHFNNNSILVIEEANAKTHIPFSVRELSVVFNTKLVYEKKQVNSIFFGNVYLNPYHPTIDNRTDAPYFTESFAYYRLILPNGLTDSSGRTKYAPIEINNATLTSYKNDVANYIKNQMKTINNPAIIVDLNDKIMGNIDLPDATKQSVIDTLSSKIESETDKCCCCKWILSSNKLSNVKHNLSLNNLDDQAKGLKITIQPNCSE